jgi:hypothetical protein
MGDFNTPSVFLFFTRKRRLEICYFKTAVRLLGILFWRADNQPPQQRFFLFAVVSVAKGTL